MLKSYKNKQIEKRNEKKNKRNKTIKQQIRKKKDFIINHKY